MTMQCSWLVTAGRLPDREAGVVETDIDAEYTKEWFLSKEEWEKPNRVQLLVEKNAAVEAYAIFLRLQASQEQASIDWVRSEFIWFGS